MVQSKRIASIDWMRDFVMLLMVLDHVSIGLDVHRIILTGYGTYGGVRDISGLYTTYIVTIVMLILLYPFCL